MVVEFGGGERGGGITGKLGRGQGVFFTNQIR